MRLFGRKKATKGTCTILCTGGSLPPPAAAAFAAAAGAPADPEDPEDNTGTSSFLAFLLAFSSGVYRKITSS